MRVRGTIHLLLLLVFLAGCKTPEPVRRFYFEHPGMGSLFKVIVYGNDSIGIASSVTNAFDQLDSLNLIMSDYIPHSELMRLSRTSGQDQWVAVSDPLLEIIQLSKNWYDWSEGYFDITVGPYTQLWRRAKRKDLLPDSLQLANASQSVGMDLVETDDYQRVKLIAHDMQLDLGGIAKGYAVDQMFDILRQNGYDHSMVDGGGDIRVGKSPPGKEGWEVLLQNFIGEDSVLVVKNTAIATSGDFYRNLEIGGKKYSHIIDPFTGIGITASRSVTVIAEDCTSADVMASVFSIVGVTKKTINDQLDKGVKVIVVERLENEIVTHHLP